jgi:hypothetical protein
MSTLQLLAKLRQRGVELSVEAKGLRYRARKGALTPELLGQLVERKQEILAVLRSQMSAIPGNAELPGIESCGLHTRGSRALAGRSVKRIYFQDALWACFQDTDGRLWHLDVVTQKLAEIIAGNEDLKALIPAEAWFAFGTLLGLVVRSREREESTGDGGKERAEPSCDNVADWAADRDASASQGDSNRAGRETSPWPESLPGCGEKFITSFNPCEICGKGTWVRYGERTLCLTCADRISRQAERIVTGVQKPSNKEKAECIDQKQNVENFPGT